MTRQNSQTSVIEACSRFVRRVSRHGERSLARPLPPEPFPPELWMRIIEEYSSHREWIALCKTCRFFHQVAQAYLYKEVVLSDVKRHNLWDTKNSLSPFERSLVKRPDLSTLVHALSLRGEIRYSGYRLLSKLDQLPNLERIQVEYAHIGVNLRHALHSHPRLRVVELVYGTLEHSLMAQYPYVQHFPGSSISELKIIKPLQGSISVPEGIWATLVPTGLRSLEISSCHNAGDNPDFILSKMMKSLKNKTLEILSINFFSRSITEFLISSPQLRHLTIDHAITDDAHLIFSLLPKDAIPLLEYYHGPADLSPILLRNRPVHTVRLSGILDPVHVEILTSLELSSVSVTRLELTVTPGGPWMWRVPIMVCHLTFPWHREIFLKSMQALSRLTSLCTVCGTLSWPHTKALSREEIIQVSQACPSLQEFVCGRDKWLMVKQNGVWERFDCSMED